MDSNQKSYFLTLCQTGNITHAANRLFISRQGLSKSIRKLESEVGTVLFKRSKDGVEPTEAGKLLLSCIKSQDELWETCMRSMHALDQGKREFIRIGMPSLYCNYDELQALYNFEIDHPDVHIEVVTKDFHDNWNDLAAGRMDLAITMLPPPEFDLPYVKLHESALSILVGSGSELARLDVVDFERDLPGETIFQTGAYESEAYAEAYERFGIRHEYVDVDRNTLCAMVAVNNGYFIAQTDLIDMFALGSNLAKPLVNAPFDANPYLVYRRNLSQRAEEFKRHIFGTL